MDLCSSLVACALPLLVQTTKKQIIGECVDNSFIFYSHFRYEEFFYVSLSRILFQKFMSVECC